MSLIRTRWLQQTEADLPHTHDWLSLAEAKRLAALRIPKRAADWRLGRWTAKQALAICLNINAEYRSLRRIEIVPSASGAPVALIDGKPAGASMSISHRDGVAICTVAPAGAEIGCDLEVIEPRSDNFIADYFTSEEQAYVSACDSDQRNLAATLIWSAKESALKALTVGLCVHTRTVQVTIAESKETGTAWSPLTAGTDGGRIFQGWWQRSNSLLRTFVACPRSSPPALIPLQECGAGRP